MLKLSHKSINQSRTALAIVLFLAAASAGQVHAEDPTYTFNIPAENTAQALTDFSRQSGIQILFPYDLAATQIAPAISGKYTIEEVLKQLLNGTSLEVAERTEESITLRPVAVGKPGESSDTSAIIVTGTRIRGGNPTSPVHLISSKDIERSGYSQVGDLIRSLPEDFSGGQNPGVINGAAGNFSNNNITNASSVNLRGLGTDANLVLLNGHRIAADGYLQGADISGIPISAIQRVEIVPDGASALYGSDAVAGVVNFVMRHDYSGSQVIMRGGGATQGGADDRSIAYQTGMSGKGSFLFGSIEIENQDQVRASDRTFTAAAPSDETLIPGQARTSIFLTGGKTLNDHIQVGGDALLSERSSDLDMVYEPYVYHNHYYTPAYSVAAFSDFELPSDWSLHVVGVASGSRNDSLTTISGIPSFSALYVYRNSTTSGEAVLNGTVLSLPSGPIKLAIGGGYRKEEFSQTADGGGNTFSSDRTISYGFAEILAPLVAPSPDRLGLHELELNISGRTERYSDFGSTSNPKIGIRYVPLGGLTLRTSWGTSFKAPTFFQLYSSNSIFLLPETYFGGTGSGTALFVRGSNPNLRPEKSKSWTIGGDYAPANSSLRLSLTAFHIAYKDRVVLTVPNLAAALSDPIYEPFIQYAPSVTDQTAVVNAADNFYDYVGGYDPAQVSAIINDVYTNAARQEIQGVDLSYRQTFKLRSGALTPFANATWLELRQQTLPTVSMAELTGTIFNPPSFKARAGISWDAGGWSANAMVNYIPSSTDTGETPAVSISSWTTADLNLAYAFGDGEGTLRRLRISLAANNLFDQAPPYTATPAASDEPHFDSTNANILGRFVTVSISKAW
jgi:iron complex outermembrane receptor protein